MDKTQLQKLFARAVQTREKAYAPYSNYHVGAALLDDNGHIHDGCNVEVANYKGTCAEGTAIAKMVSEGGHKIKAIAVVGPGDDLCTPCGQCRQLIREFADANTRIFVGDKNGKLVKSYTMKKLLPDSFGPENLSKGARAEAFFLARDASNQV